MMPNFDDGFPRGLKYRVLAVAMRVRAFWLWLRS